MFGLDVRGEDEASVVSCLIVYEHDPLRPPHPLFPLKGVKGELV
jgi:hypothetical protein